MVIEKKPIVDNNENAIVIPNAFLCTDEGFITRIGYRNRSYLNSLINTSTNIFLPDM